MKSCHKNWQKMLSLPKKHLIYWIYKFSLVQRPQNARFSPAKSTEKLRIYSWDFRRLASQTIPFGGNTAMEISNIQIPTTGFLRLPQVLALIPVGKSTWWRGIGACLPVIVKDKESVSWAHDGNQAATYNKSLYIGIVRLPFVFSSGNNLWKPFFS